MYLRLICLKSNLIFLSWPCNRVCVEVGVPGDGAQRARGRAGGGDARGVEVTLPAPGVLSVRPLVLCLVTCFSGLESYFNYKHQSECSHSHVTFISTFNFTRSLMLKAKHHHHDYRCLNELLLHMPTLCASVDQTDPSFVGFHKVENEGQWTLKLGESSNKVGDVIIFQLQDFKIYQI